MGGAFHYALPEQQITNSAFQRYMDKVCDATGIHIAQLLSDSRRQEIVDLRHVLMCVGLHEYGLSGNTVGRIMKKDRTSTIHATKKVKGLCSDPRALNQFKHLQQCLHVADDIYFEEWGHHFNSISKWLTPRK